MKRVRLPFSIMQNGKPLGKMQRLFGFVMVLLVTAFSILLIYAGVHLMVQAIPGRTLSIERDISYIDVATGGSFRRHRPGGVYVHLRGDADLYFVEPMLLSTPFENQWRKARRAKLTYQADHSVRSGKEAYTVVGIVLDGKTHMPPTLYMIERMVQGIIMLFSGVFGVVIMGYTLLQILRGKS